MIHLFVSYQVKQAVQISFKIIKFLLTKYLAYKVRVDELNFTIDSGHTCIMLIIIF